MWHVVALPPQGLQNQRKSSHNSWEEGPLTASLSPMQAGPQISSGASNPYWFIPPRPYLRAFPVQKWRQQVLPVAHPWSSPEAVAAVSSASSHSFSCCSRCSSRSWCRCSCSITCWCEDSISARLRSQASCGPEAREVMRLHPAVGLSGAGLMTTL